MPTLDDLRAAARAHATELAAVHWVSVQELATRWGVSDATVRKIPRAELPYLSLGKGNVRRYDPRDVERYENEQKRPAEPQSTEPAA